MNRFSPEAVRVFRCLRRSPNRWLTCDQVATEAGVSLAAAKVHLRRLISVGLISVNALTIPRIARWAKPTTETGKQFLEGLQLAESGYLATGTIKETN